MKSKEEFLEKRSKGDEAGSIRTMEYFTGHDQNVIKDTEILVIDDNNFYDYFDDDGYLKYDFKTNSKKILFLTFLTNKNLYFTDSITLTSNKQTSVTQKFF